MATRKQYRKNKDSGGLRPKKTDSQREEQPESNCQSGS